MFVSRWKLRGYLKRGEKRQELLETVGLADKEKAYPSQLRAKQRVAIARALATNPSTLCDEATSALDPTTTQSILELIKELNQKTGVTVIIITHEMKVIEQICHRVAIIDKSRIEEVGWFRCVPPTQDSGCQKAHIYKWRF